jgi:hypothetical protein
MYTAYLMYVFMRQYHLVHLFSSLKTACKKVDCTANMPLLRNVAGTCLLKGNHPEAVPTAVSLKVRP